MTDAVIVICGPTASGKSRLAGLLAARAPVEIISADSAQVYRGMDVGTAKPGLDERARTPHHLIDIREPDDPFSAADFREAVLQLVPDIISRGRRPLIVGGTMLYLKALKEGLAVLPEADPELRSKILEEARAHGWEQLHRELESVDPDAARRIRPSDTQRLQRAVEVYRLTGQTLTSLQEKAVEPCPFPLVEIAIMPPDRKPLHEAIARRFQEMLDRGFVEEVRLLHDNPRFHKELPAIRAVGYRQVWGYLDGEYDYDTMVNKGVAATRQLAKRQYTWLRGWKGLNLLSTPDIEEALKILPSDTIFRKSPG